MSYSLILKGRESLGNINVLDNLWINVFKPFFNIIYSEYYRNELELLNLLLKWASSNKLLTFRGKDFIIYSKSFYTHRRYVRVGRSRREFGDVTFLILFSSHSKRIGYVNTFQLKVGFDLFDLLRKIDLRQLDFYRSIFTSRILSIDDGILICDFLYYWLIKKVKPRIIFEVPLSVMWIDNAYRYMFSSFYYNKLDLLQGLSIMLRSLLLVTGVNVDEILKYATPSLKLLFYQLLKYGVEVTTHHFSQFNDGEFNRFPNEESFKPEYPINSSIVIATEVFVEKEFFRK